MVPLTAPSYGGAAGLARDKRKARPLGRAVCRSSSGCGKNERDIAVDPIILGEIRFGILLLPRGKRRARLERWFDDGLQRLVCLPWETDTGLRWARLLATLRGKRRAMPIKDSLIAATALVHDLIVVTRNESISRTLASR